MKVYCCLAGFAHEGDDLYKVFSSESKAKAWVAFHSNRDDDYWESPEFIAGDYFSYQEMEVE